jgi:hypothetical protein
MWLTWLWFEYWPEVKTLQELEVGRQDTISRQETCFQTDASEQEVSRAGEAIPKKEDCSSTKKETTRPKKVAVEEVPRPKSVAEKGSKRILPGQEGGCGGGSQAIKCGWGKDQGGDHQFCEGGCEGGPQPTSVTEERIKEDTARHEKVALEEVLRPTSVALGDFEAGKEEEMPGDGEGAEELSEEKKIRKPRVVTEGLNPKRYRRFRMRRQGRKERPRNPKQVKLILPRRVKNTPDSQAWVT